MNGPHTPVFTRHNRFTQLTERIAEANAQNGKAAGRSVEQFMNATPVISAKRYGVDKNTGLANGPDFMPEPEDPQAAMMASARAAAMGVQNFNSPTFDDDMPGDIGHVASDPSDAEIDAMLRRAGTKVPGVDATAQGAADPAARVAPASAGRQVTLPRGTPMGVARQMPNFANVEGFDLVRKVAVVDGMEFQLSEVDVVGMKKFAIQVVLDNVTFQLAKALVALGIPAEMAQATADKMRETVEVKSDEAVQPVQSREDARGVLPEPNETGRTGREVQSLPDRVEQQPEPPNSGAKVQPDTQGNSERTPSLSPAFRPSHDVAYLMGDGEFTPE